MGTDWYVIHVLTGKEEGVKKHLEDITGGVYNLFIPRRELRERRLGAWHKVIRILFPGYVLIQGEITTDCYYHIKLTPNVIKLIDNEGEPVPIHKSEIETLNRLTGNSDIIEISDVLIIGNKVTVIDGPLVACEAIIESVNKRKGRVKVRLNFLGEKRTVELSVNVVEPIEVS